MKKILFLSMSSEDYRLYRRDLNVLLNELIKSDNTVEIYDVKKSQLIEVNPQKSNYYGMIPSKYSISRNKFVIFFNFIWFLLRNQKKYDLVQINYVREEYLVLAPLVKNLGGKLLILVYGSDFNYRTKIKDHFSSLYKKADKILFTNPIIIENFRSQHKNLNLNGKLEKLLLPLDHFRYYEDFTFNNKFEAKAKLNLDRDKTIVSIGTCYYANEQHELIIEQLQNLQNPQKYTLIFNLTGFDTVNTSRVDTLEQLIQEKLPKFEYKIVRGRLSDEEVANYRLATDIFINLRKMDQLVLSMLESNLAYSYVITGEWLPYQDYRANTNTYVISDFNELNNTIEKVAELPENQKKILLEENRKYVKNTFDEKEAINSWMSTFNYYLSK